MNKINNLQRPSIEETISCIKNIQSLNLIDTDIDVIKDRLFILFKGYVHITPKDPYRSIYRGVPWPTKPNYISDLSYPKPEYVKSYGRVNRPNESIFYGSTSIQAIFHELKLKPGDKVALSKWQIQKPMFLNNIGYTYKCFKKLRSKRNLPSWSAIKANDTNKDEINIKVREYFSNEFTKNIPQGQEYLYKVSIAIAEKHFRNNIFNGLLYPSIVMNAEADNIALKTNFVDEYLAIEKVIYVKVIDIDKNNEYRYEVLTHAEEFTKSGEINWAQKWMMNDNNVLIFKVENDRWVARDERGNIVDPL